jgi:hypothetical protein
MGFPGRDDRGTIIFVEKKIMETGYSLFSKAEFGYLELVVLP